MAEESIVEKENRNEPKGTGYAVADQAIYLAEREAISKRLNELGDILDKGRVALAGGAILFSATVLKDLMPNATARTRWMVGWSWLVLAITLVLSLYCVYAAGRAHQRQLEILDDDHREGLKEGRLSNDRSNPWDVRLRRLNPLSLWLLLIGLAVMGAALFSAFTSNLQPTQGNPMNKNNTKQTTVRPGTDSTKTFGPRSTPVTAQKPSGSSGGNSDSGSGGTKK
ncbi:MAG: hypothetical protein BGO01_11605 [Armatimonadetes bacterium 55-13]|nr:MAG: hypothetical protein BGO01_11605 [Armatimonadetes bacterium 55-13]